MGGCCGRSHSRPRAGDAATMLKWHGRPIFPRPARASQRSEWDMRCRSRHWRKWAGDFALLRRGDQRRPGDRGAELARRYLTAVAAHGQTLYHDPPKTIQWLDPALVAAEVGCAVVSDFRRADCAAGGQGARWCRWRIICSSAIRRKIGCCSISAGSRISHYLPADGGDRFPDRLRHRAGKLPERSSSCGRPIRAEPDGTKADAWPRAGRRFIRS